MRSRIIALFSGLVLLTACGGAPDLPPASAVSITITPSTASIKVGETVTLQGTTTGFTNPTLSWWEQDQHDHAVNGYGEENCDNITAANSNLIATCQFGYLTLAPGPSATYHAPSVPGTYHVTFRAIQFSNQQLFDSVERRVTATITVTL